MISNRDEDQGIINRQLERYRAMLRLSGIRLVHQRNVARDCGPFEVPTVGVAALLLKMFVPSEEFIAG